MLKDSFLQANFKRLIAEFPFYLQNTSPRSWEVKFSKIPRAGTEKVIAKGSRVPSIRNRVASDRVSKTFIVKDSVNKGFMLLLKPRQGFKRSASDACNKVS